MAGSFAIAAPHTMAAWSRFASTKSSSAVRARGPVSPQIDPDMLPSPPKRAAAFPQHARQHHIRVYNLVALSVASAGCGSGLMILTGLEATLPVWIPVVAGFVPHLWLTLIPPASSQARTALLLTFALIEGMALAPIVKMSAAAGVLGSALMLAAAVFGGFSAASFLAPRASLIAYQGPLFGMLLGMMAISMVNVIYPISYAHSLILYGGLALFSAFIAVDTQIMVERASCGSADPAQDALRMFLFVRIAQILRNMRER